MNNRPQFAELLLSICENVKMGYPEGSVELPLVTYAQITRTSLGKWEERIEYQVDVYDNTFAKCLQLTMQIDELLSGNGYVLTYESPDTATRADTGLYHKVLNYYALVNTNEGNIFSRG